MILSFISIWSRSRAYKIAIAQTTRGSSLFASRHLSSFQSRSADDQTVQNKPTTIDPKKQAILQKLNILTEENQLQKDIDLKTGAQLRKERKGELRKKRLQGAAIEKQKFIKAGGIPVTLSAAKSGKKLRFVLGNKIEVLTATQLLELVKSTAPYLFPETAPKMVLDDEDDEENEESSEPSSGSTAKSGATDSARSSILLSDDPKQGHIKLLREFGASIPPTDKPTEQQRIDFFALCLAAHFSSVATYVPTDVDSKIRGHCWRDPSEAVLLGQFEVLKNALHWDVEAVSTRTMRVRAIGDRPLSGHDGEWLGVLCGAWGAFLRIGHTTAAAEAESLIVAELEREAAMFSHLRTAEPNAQNDLQLLKAAAILTHNVGDVDQGLGYWYDEEDAKTPVPAVLIANKQRFSRLAHERYDRFGGEFGKAKLIYKELLAAEGHRNYPLREPKCLRRAPELMLPLSPFLEGWGRSVASHPGLGYEEKLQVLRQLLRGCDSTSKAWCVPNQVGYYRALNGFASVLNLDRCAKDLGSAEVAVLKEHTTRMHLGLSEKAFADKLGARARELLEDS